MCKFVSTFGKGVFLPNEAEFRLQIQVRDEEGAKHPAQASQNQSHEGTNAVIPEFYVQISLKNIQTYSYNLIHTNIYLEVFS